MLLAGNFLTRVCDGHGTANRFVIIGVEGSMNPMRDIQICCTKQEMRTSWSLQDSELEYIDQKGGEVVSIA